MGGPVSGAGVSDAGSNAQSVGYGLIGYIKAADLTLTTDQALIMTPCNSFRVERIVIKGNTGVPVLAAGAIYTAASKGGNALMATTTTFTLASSSSKIQTLEAGDLSSVEDSDVQSVSQLYLALTTANALAATADFYVYGEVFA